MTKARGATHKGHKKEHDAGKKPKTARADSKKTPDRTAPCPDKQELEDQVLRLRADFDNFRKRTDREKGDTYRRAHEDLMLELLPVLDHLALGLSAAVEHEDQESNGAFAKGYSMLSDQLLGVLKQFGLRPIESPGMEFDPNVHEAVSYIPAADCPEGAVVSEIQKGYYLGDKLLRAARVVVCRGATADADERKDGKGE
jgi:molecular chaperone GrpE